MSEESAGKDFITTQEWSRKGLDEILGLAGDLKGKFRGREPHSLLPNRTLFMLFYNQSLRTRNSFEAGMTQLGGHAHDLSPKSIYRPALAGDEIPYATERVSDVARVLSRYGDAISIRIYGEQVGWIYGKGNQMVREFARWADVPVINMECDIYHPCQVMADVLTLREKLGRLSGKKVVVSWAYSGGLKPVAVPQSCVLGFTRFGADVVLAHPRGLELDPEIMDHARRNAEEAGGSFEVGYDMGEAFEGAHAVYPKSWSSLELMPPKTDEPKEDAMVELHDRHRDWICDVEKLDLCDRRVIYMHCLPADRGQEVADDVIDGDRSVVFDEAENRLHVQKAILALTVR
ncbi:MAG: ornithine carbamoyltransferase [Candidatus Geothermarchaeales archaeon]